MKLFLDWARLLELENGTQDNLMYSVDLDKLPCSPGIYVFGRCWGDSFEALYVGKAINMRSRVRGQLNNLRLMHHLKSAKTGTRVLPPLLAGELVTRQGQTLDRVLPLAEKTLIRYFMSEGHDLVNKQGVRIRRHELESSGKHAKAFIIPRLMYLERGGNE